MFYAAVLVSAEVFLVSQNAPVSVWRGGAGVYILRPDALLPPLRYCIHGRALQHEGTTRHSCSSIHVVT